jgi:hypothetical protein
MRYFATWPATWSTSKERKSQEADGEGFGGRTPNCANSTASSKQQTRSQPISSHLQGASGQQHAARTSKEQLRGSSNKSGMDRGDPCYRLNATAPTLSSVPTQDCCPQCTPSQGLLYVGLTCAHPSHFSTALPPAHMLCAPLLRIGACHACTFMGTPQTPISDPFRSSLCPRFSNSDVPSTLPCADPTLLHEIL